MSDRIDILFVTPQTPPISRKEFFRGGIERFVRNTAEGLVYQGANVKILTVEYLSTEVSDKKNGVLKPGMYKFVSPFYTYYSIPSPHNLDQKISLLVDQCDSVVVFVVDNGGPFSKPTPRELLEIAPLVSERYPLILVIPFPMTEISFYYTPNEKKAFWDNLKNLAKFSDCIIFPSNHCKETYKGLAPEDKCTVVYPGIHKPQIESKLNKNEIAVISRAGLWAIHKNHFPLLEALHILRNRGQKLRAHFIGPDTELLKSAISQLSLNDQVIIHGNISEQRRVDILSKVRLHVLPSAIEAFGYASAEALSFKVPIVACEGTAVPELGSGGIYLCRPVLPCRFASICGFNEHMLIEPEIEELATCISTALEEADAASHLIQIPQTVEYSGACFLEVCRAVLGLVNNKVKIDHKGSVGHGR